MAQRAIPGESKAFTLFDLVNPGEGYITTGATVTFDLLDGAGTVVATGAGASGGTNDWSATLTMPATEGRYTLRVAIAYAGTTTYQEDTVDVRAFLNRGGTTLRELRRLVARLVADLTLCTATAATDGSTFTDQSRLRRSVNQYTGSQGYAVLAAAANVGVENARYVAGSDGAGTLTFSPAFPATFAAGDVLEVHNDVGNGWPVEEKHDAINAALRLAASMGGARLSAEMTAAFDADSPNVTVPSAFQKVYAVERQDSAGEWHRLTKATRMGSPGWWAAGDGTVMVLGGGRYAGDGQTIRLWGTGRHDDLTDDEDATLVLPEFVRWQAGYELLMAGDRRDPERRGWIADFRAKSEKWSRAAVPPSPVGSAIVRHG